MAGIRGVTLVSPGGVVGPTRRNTDERRFPPDDPNDLPWSTWDYRELFTESGPFFSLAQVSCVYLELV